MKVKHILLSCISLLWVSFLMMAQEETPMDTLQKNKQKYGLRVGIDISKPARTLLDDDYSGFEIIGDFRITEKFYAAAELGNEKKDRFEANLNSSTSGSYAKVGFDFNAYQNWLGMTNSIYGGLRYGFSTFTQELLAYGIYTTNPAFPPTFNVSPKEFKGLTAHWIEFVVGVKVELIHNVYLSLNLQLKRKLSEDQPENFDNLYIPGFNRTYDYSEYGAGFGYSISYLIPIFKK